MTSIHLKDAYYSAKIDDDGTCILKFLSSSKLLKLFCIVVFTKLTKLPLAMLRIQRYTVSIYIDNIIAID